MKFVRPVFVDVLGRMIDFTIPIREIDSLIDEGKGFDGSSVEGFARIEESDLVFRPDLNTLKILPWEYKASEKTWREAIVFGGVYKPDKTPFEGDTRALLENTVKKHAGFGTLKVGVELEFFVFKNDENPSHTDQGGYFRSGLCGEVRKEAQLMLNEMGVSTEFDHHEVSPSQHEIDLLFDDALKMADAVVLSKYVVKKVARKLGFYASFMPKPIAGINGSGMHLHISLWRNDNNLFFDEEKKGLSKTGESYVAGLIKYGKEIQVGLNQWVNSFKRLCPGFEAPTYLVWGTRNRSAYVRIPEYQKGKEKATRIELRSPDPACNPYLAMSLIHAAGIQGIKEKLIPPPRMEKNVFHAAESERKKLLVEELSPSLEKALELFEESELVRKTLPEHVFKKFVENKRIECARFNKHVTDFEIKNYFSVL